MRPAAAVAGVSGYAPGLLPECAQQARPAEFASLPMGRPAGGYPVRFVSSPAPWMRVFPPAGVDVYMPSEPTYPPPAAWVQNVMAAARSGAFGAGPDMDDLRRWLDELPPMPMPARTYELDWPADERDGAE